jgi:hypothetical protein
MISFSAQARVKEFLKCIRIEITTLHVQARVVQYAGADVCCPVHVAMCQFEQRTKAAETFAGLSAGYGDKAFKIFAAYGWHNRSEKGQQ